MGEAWNFLYQGLLQSLVFFYHLTGNFGLAIIALTAAIRTLLIPLSLPSLRSAKKMQEIKPHIDALKEKYGKDKMRHQQEQMKLFKEHGVNPAAGCLPQILQIVILIALYQVFINFIKAGRIDGGEINMHFFYLNLANSDPYYILPVLAGATQFLMSVMMLPAVSHPHLPKETKKEKKGEEDMATAMQKQMVFMMPMMTVVIALKFPSGLALYWVATTVFSIIQQYFISGVGGLKPYMVKLGTYKLKIKN